MTGLFAATRVGPSALAGSGTFSTAAIPAGTALRLPEPVNHSCDPNLWCTAPGRFEARRDLEPGEELTYDYATVLADPQFLLRCRCDTYRCRQLVTGDDWRIPQLQQRYAGRWGPAVHAAMNTP